MGDVYAQRVWPSVAGRVSMLVAMNLTAAHVEIPALPTKPASTENVCLNLSLSVLTGIAHTQSLECIVTM